MAKRIDPSHAQANINLAGLYAKLENFEDAKKSYEYLIAKFPEDAIYLNAYGKVLFELKDYAQAIDKFSRAAKIKPDFAEIFFNLGNAYQKIKDYNLAIPEFQRAIQLNPSYGDAHKNLGNTYWELRKIDEAIKCFEKTMAIKGDEDLYTQGSYLMAKSYICDWENYDERLRDFESKSVLSSFKTSLPGVATWVSGSGNVMKCLADQWVNEHAKYKINRKRRQIKAERKIKVGYFSPDLRVHALASLIVELLEVHDRSTFEVYAFSFIKSSDAMQSRISSAVDHFIDASEMPDEEIYALVDAKKI